MVVWFWKNGLFWRKLSVIYLPKAIFMTWFFYWWQVTFTFTPEKVREKNGDSVNRASWIGKYWTNTSCLYTKMFTNMSSFNQNKRKYHHLFLTIVTCHEMKAVVHVVSDHVTFHTGGVLKSTLDCQNSWFQVTIDV